MTLMRLLAGRHILSRSVIAAGLILLGAAGLRLGMAADRFPFDQELLLETAPIPPSQRVPVLAVEGDGSATIFLWCQTVSGRVQVSGTALRIDAGPVPEGMPRYMSPGQCTPARMQADHAVLAQLTQVTGWRRSGETITLSGPQTLRFRVSDH